MYGTIINTKILMQILSPQIAQKYKCNYDYYFPSPLVWTRLCDICTTISIIQKILLSI